MRFYIGPSEPFRTAEEAFRAGYTNVGEHLGYSEHCPWHGNPNTYCLTCNNWQWINQGVWHGLTGIRMLPPRFSAVTP